MVTNTAPATPLRPALAAPAGLTAKFFRGLGDPTRVRILQLLEVGEMTVSELMAQTGTLQGRLSSHLACLRWCGFVTSRREGRRVYYRLTDRRVRQMLRLAEQFLEANGDSVEMCQIVGECPPRGGKATSRAGGDRNPRGGNE